LHRFFSSYIVNINVVIRMPDGYDRWVGVGIGFTPPRFLQPGDTVRITIEGIGELKNQVASL
jgi:2-keto-4-pentenoate hydratase/2-oxohepta-3-ene-1,7-dioic acid hydratase in catechol pathway